MPPFLQNLLALPAKTKAHARRLGRRHPGDRVHHAQDRHGAVVLADRERPRSRPDRQDHGRARRAGHRLRAAQQRHGARRPEVGARRRRGSRSPARACRPRAAAASRATSCSTSPSSAPRSSSSRSPTSVRWRVRSPRRSAASRASRTRRVQIVMPQDDLFQDEATPATAAVMLGNSADTLQPGRRARHGAAHRLLREGPQVRERDDHRLHAARSCGRPTTARRRRRRLEQGRAPRRATPARWRARSTRCSPPRSARARPQVKVNADLNMDETTEKELTYGAKGTPLKTTEETEKLKGGSARPPAARPARAPTSRPTPTARRSGSGNSQLPEQEGHDRLRRRQEGHRHQGRRRRGQQAQRRAAGRQVGPAGRLQLAEADGRPRPPASTRRAATRSRAAQMAFAKPADAQGGPGADDDARPAQVGRPRPRQPAVPLLHDPRHEASARPRTSARRPG